jgi:hypothetical protein
MARVSIPSDMVSTIVQLIASISVECGGDDDKKNDMPIFGTTLSKPEDAVDLKKRKKCDSDNDKSDDESEDSGDESNDNECDVIDDYGINGDN